MVSDYTWTDQLEAFCVCIMMGADRNKIDAAFKIIPETQKLTKMEEHWDFAGPDSQGNDTVQIDALGAAVVAFEGNGWTGVDPAIIKQISAPLSVSLYRNVNAVMQMIVAKNGVVVRDFDPLLYDADRALPEEEAFSWRVSDGRDPNPIALGFALAERLTGIVIKEDWLLKTQHPTYKTGHGNS